MKFRFLLSWTLSPKEDFRLFRIYEYLHMKAKSISVASVYAFHHTPQGREWIAEQVKKQKRY